MYLSKEDRQPFLFNVRVSELSLYARAWHHAKSTYRSIRPVNKADPFIVSCGQNARFALGIIDEHLTDLRRSKADSRNVFEPNGRCKITRDVLDALGDGVSHIYLQGPPGLGKTEIVDFYLKGKKYWKGGEPSGFLFGTLSDDVDFIWFEDFDMFKYSGHLNTLLSLMDHKETTISRKGVDDRTVVSPARHIYISNYNIPSDYPMFTRRVKIIECYHKTYECLGCGNFELSADQLIGDLDRMVQEIQQEEDIDTTIIEELLSQF